MHISGGVAASIVCANLYCGFLYGQTVSGVSAGTAEQPPQALAALESTSPSTASSMPKDVISITPVSPGNLRPENFVCPGASPPT